MLITLLIGVGSSEGQALYKQTIGNGTRLLLVAQPLSDASTLSWPTLADGELVKILHTTSGKLTLAVDLEEALAGDETVAAPPVVIVVGAASSVELANTLERVLAGRDVAEWRTQPQGDLVEGGVERRLGRAGNDAMLRLETSLPMPNDPRRAAIEVLWELLPELLSTTVPGLRARVEKGSGLLETRVDAELAQVKLSSLRLSLARIASEPQLEEDRVETARRRLAVRRLASLEAHPAAARGLMELWLQGGAEAVEQFAFGLEGVTVESVRTAALEWLPQHPGHAVLILPPRVFNPRFAAQPEIFQLENDLSVAVLERPAAPVSAISLRPVLLPDVDGEISATVLARVAAELRSDPEAPGWVRVKLHPPVLELAGSPDGFAELCEVLQRALDTVSRDTSPADAPGGGARRRALRLMATHLGLDETMVLSPAELLRPGNLALGAVVPDAEAAADALHKFAVGGARSGGLPASRSLDGTQRSREAAPGEISVLAVALELDGMVSPHAGTLAGVLLSRRISQALPGVQVEVLRPLVPGRRMIVLLVSAAMQLDELELEISEAWPSIIPPVREDELVELRRRVASDLASQGSGSLGRSRKCAAVAAGITQWRPAAEVELEILTVSAEKLSEVIVGFSPLSAQITTGAGVLPISQ